MSPKLLTALLRSLAISLPVCLLLLLIASAVLASMPDPAPLVPLCGYAILAIGAAICGFLAVKFHQKQGLLCGGLTGLLYAGILFLVGLAFGMQNALPALLLTLGCTAISAVFGYLALPKAPSAASVRRGALQKAASRVEKQLSGR